MRPTRAKTTKRKGDDAQPPAERDPIAELLEQYGATGIKAKLHRMDPKTRKPAYLETIEPVNPATLQEDVQEKHGGGEYRAYIYVNNEYQPGKYLDFSIAGLPKSNDDDRIARLEATIRTPAPAQTAGLTMVRDIIAIATPLVAAAGALIIPILTRKDGSSAAELLKLTQDAEDRGERRGVELGRLKAGSGHGDGGGMMDVANKFLPPILQLAANRRAEVQQSNPPAPTEPMRTPPPQPPALSPGDPANRAEYAWLTTVRPFLPHLVNQARIGADPFAVMNFALTQLPPHVLQALDDSTKRDDFETIMRGELMVHLHQQAEWAEEFLAELIDFAQHSPDDEETAPVAVTTPVAKRARKGK